MADARRIIATALLAVVSMTAAPALGQAVNVATIQFESLDHAFDENLRRATALVRQAKEKHADLDLYIGTSFLEVHGEDFYNTFFLATPDGSVAGWVRKQVSAGAQGYFFRGDTGDHTIDTPLGRIGVGICQENYRCFLPRQLHQQRAQLLLMPYSYPDLSEAGGLMSPSGAYVAGWYARHLGIPVITSNKTGVWPQVEGAYFPGASAIVDRQGMTIVELDDRPGVIGAEVVLPEDRRATLDFDCIGAFLPDLTLGSWIERRITWASIAVTDWLGMNPDDAIALEYQQSAARAAAASRQGRPDSRPR